MGYGHDEDWDEMLDDEDILDKETLAMLEYHGMIWEEFRHEPTNQQGHLWWNYRQFGKTKK